ncbi:MAG: alpha/beta hydrolase [Saprospiraceae bacterium]|jgi:pimeloyl-ACP methyl ester carboxylesterase|nr:alpha/beta hydrolase [Saprospiraceae bacterium]
MIRNVLNFVLTPAVVLITLIVFYQGEIPVEKLKGKYADGHSQFMPLMGMNIHYRDEGNTADSLPLLLIHGTSSSLHTWDSLVNRLSPFKRIIRLDLPAFGLTGPNPGQDYSIGFYNRVIDSFLIRLNINRYAIAGNSLGGSIAWHQAIYTPEKISRLILINSGGYPKQEEKGNIGFKLAAMPVVGTLLSKFTPKALIRRSIEDVYSNDALISDKLIDRYFDLLLREGNRKATITLFKKPSRPEPDRIKTIQTPTLIIWGEDDQLIDVANAYRFKEDIPNSRLLVIPQSGHVPMEETPEPVHHAIKAMFGL